jgi:hypothetical protein
MVWLGGKAQPKGLRRKIREDKFVNGVVVSNHP